MAEPPAPLAAERGPAVTEDAFLDGRLLLRQPATGYRAGLDAVLLAATIVAAGRGARQRLADLGAGVGAVGLCAARRNPDLSVVLVEREPELLSLATANLAANRLQERVRVAAADLEQARPADLSSDGLEADAFDFVAANPPFHRAGHGRMPPDRLRAASHVMTAGGLERWVRLMARLAAPGGIAVMIHRADAIIEMLAAFEGRFGNITLLPVNSRAGEAAGRVIIAGRKGSRAGLRLLPGLVVHDREGHGFSTMLQAILRDGAGLDLWSSKAPLLVPPGKAA